MLPEMLSIDGEIVEDVGQKERTNRPWNSTACMRHHPRQQELIDLYVLRQLESGGQRMLGAIDNGVLQLPFIDYV